MLFDYLEEAAALHRSGRSFVLATVVRAEKPTSAKPGAKALVTAEGKLVGWVGGSCAEPTVLREAIAALRDEAPRLIRICPPEELGRRRDGVRELAQTCVSGGILEVYLEPHLPRPHLVVVGHLPIAECLVVLGKDVGYEVTVLSPEASADRFGRADRVASDLDFGAVRSAPERTFVLVASHGNYDEPALEAALGTGARYVALVASRKRAQSVLDALRASGVSEEALSRLRYPAGLDLGAVTPEEIALSILAEIVQVRRSAATAKEPRSIGLPIAPAVEARDPVCGMMIDVATSRYHAEHGGERYYFCCAGCQRAFERNPEGRRVGK